MIEDQMVAKAALFSLSDCDLGLRSPQQQLCQTALRLRGSLGCYTQPFLLLSFIHVRPESWSDDSSSFFFVVVVPSLFCLM